MASSIQNHRNHDLLNMVHTKIILKEHNKENLLSLLLLSNPKLTLTDLVDDKQRIQAMQDLMIAIHPSNFSYHEDAQGIFEDVQRFYDICNKKIMESKESKGRRRGRSRPISPTSVVDQVVQFNVRQKWDFLKNYTRPLPPEKLSSGKTVAPLVAYQCINARGAIAHGKRPSLIYSWENARACVGLSVQQVLEKHGGYKTICGGRVDDIKVEIINRGPVISFSFIPTKKLLEKYPNSILQSRIKKHQYCLIVGWTLTEFGEVWLVQSYFCDEIMNIPVGQFNIEETIVFPKDNFKNVTWQQGPYFDKDMSNNNEWFVNPEIELHLTSKELEDFVRMFGKVGIYQAITEKVRFVIRDTKCIAHSRSCNLKDITFDHRGQMWKVLCSFNDNGIHPLLDK